MTPISSTLKEQSVENLSWEDIDLPTALSLQSDFLKCLESNFTKFIDQSAIDQFNQECEVKDKDSEPRKITCSKVSKPLKEFILIKCDMLGIATIRSELTPGKVPESESKEKDAQFSNIKKFLSSWKEFSEIHGGLTIKDFSFLRLDEFILMSYIQMLLSMLNSSKESKNLGEIFQTIALLFNNEWKSSSPKELLEGFEKLGQLLKIPKESLDKHRRHFKFLGMISKPICYDQLLDKADGIPSLESRKEVIKYYSGLITELSNKFLIPHFKNFLHECFHFYKKAHHFYSSGLELLGEGIASNNTLQIFKSKRQIKRGKVWKDWIHNIVINLLSVLQQFKPNELFNRDFDFEKLMLIFKKINLLSNGLIRSSEYLYRSIFEFECLSIVHNHSTPTRPETDDFGIWKYAKFIDIRVSDCLEFRREFLLYKNKFSTLPRSIDDESIVTDLASKVFVFMSEVLNKIDKKQKKKEKKTNTLPKELISIEQSLIAKVNESYSNIQKKLQRLDSFSIDLGVAGDHYFNSKAFLEIINVQVKTFLHYANFLKEIGSSLITKKTQSLQIKKDDPILLKVMDLCMYVFEGIAVSSLKDSMKESAYENFQKASRDFSKEVYGKFRGEKAIKVRNVNHSLSLADNSIFAEKLSQASITLQLVFGCILPSFAVCFRGISSTKAPSIFSEKYIPDDSWLDEIDNEETNEILEEIDSSELKEMDATERKKDTKKSAALSASQSLKVTKPIVSKKVEIVEFREPSLAYLDVLQNIHEIGKDIIVPMDMMGKKLKQIQLAKYQQLHAGYSMHLIMKMLSNTMDLRNQETLASSLFHWGYLFLEQGLTVELNLDSEQALQHHLGQLSDQLGLTKDSCWLRNVGPFDSRYPFSCLGNRDRQHSVSLKVNTEFGAQSQSIKEVSGTMNRWHEEALVLQISALRKRKMPVSESEIKQLHSLAEGLKKHKYEVSPLEKNPISAEHSAVLLRISSILNIMLDKRVWSISDPSKQVSKRIQNVHYHLKMLTNVAQLIQHYPQPEFWPIHAHLILFSSQYLIENLGSLLAIQQEAPVFTHDLQVYGTCYGLYESLSEEEIELIEHLNVKKGLEYTFMYFSKRNSEMVSPFMNLLSELIQFSKIVTTHGEDFVPRSMSKKINKKNLFNQLIDTYGKLTNLVQKLLEQHLLR